MLLRYWTIHITMMHSIDDRFFIIIITKDDILFFKTTKNQRSPITNNYIQSMNTWHCNKRGPVQDWYTIQQSSSKNQTRTI